MKKYFLKGDWEKEYKEVSKREYMNAERNAGFRSKIYGEPATASFSGSGISGEVKYS